MQDLPRRRATYADLEAVPPHLVAELIDGELVTHPRPRARHAYSASILGGILSQRFHVGNGGPGGWWIVDEPELHLLDDVAVPDIAGWKRERMPIFPDTAFISLVPDWLCEFLSPSTVRYDRGSKRDMYARNNVQHLWHVDPESRLLECFELRDGLWVLLKTYKDNDEIAAPPFAEVPFALGLLWPN